jgi:hypothetical protein
MAFLLFLLVNASLFIRPAEVVPGLIGWNIYEALIIACFLSALPEIFAFFGRRSLAAQPVTLCVFALLMAVPLAYLSRLDLEKAAETGFAFAKVVVYYVLLLSIVNTPGRLRAFLFWVVGCCAVMMLVALLRFQGVIEIQLPQTPGVAGKPGEGAKRGPTNDAFAKEYVRDPDTGELRELRRLVGTGLFQDPNELCLAAVIAVPLCLFGLMDPRLGAARLLLLPVLLLLGTVMYFTYSRGGFLGLCAGLLTLFHARYGWRKSLALGALALPLLAVLFAGRMTSIETGSGTGQSRIQLWSEWLEAFRGSPLFGVGVDSPDVGISHVAHNSFLQSYADLGILGGTLFVGAFYAAFLTLRRARSVPAVSREMGLLQPYLLASFVGMTVCLLTLSLSYVIPTYMILGLATVYAGVALAPAPGPVLSWDLRLVQRMAVAGLGCLGAIYLFMRVFRA